MVTLAMVVHSFSTEAKINPVDNSDVSHDLIKTS